ncbi:MAG TPA: type II toxin-antitoxin system VapC family toxin [Nitrospirota bacterium]|nr:type II toxin-antitoxin system VapC family toxin [Nitrospirota bacterium]
MKVLDASVVAKWYKEESGSKDALQLKDSYVSGDFDITVPDLIIYELANCIRFSPGSDDKDVTDVVENFTDIGIDIVVPTLYLLDSASKFSFKYNITIYDAVYLALAKAVNAELITADKKCYERIKEETGVRLL